MLAVVLVVIETSDVIFAVDSIPAIFGVTREPFVVFSATALVLLGLRSMYFLLAGARDRFAYLDVGLAVILVFIGAKFLLTEVVEIGVGVSLLVIVGVMTAAIVASLMRKRERLTRLRDRPSGARLIAPRTSEESDVTLQTAVGAGGRRTERHRRSAVQRPGRDRCG